MSDGNHNEPAAQGESDALMRVKKAIAVALDVYVEIPSSTQSAEGYLVYCLEKDGRSPLSRRALAPERDADPMT